MCDKCEAKAAKVLAKEDVTEQVDAIANVAVQLSHTMLSSCERSTAALPNSLSRIVHYAAACALADGFRGGFGPKMAEIAEKVREVATSRVIAVDGEALEAGGSTKVTLPNGAVVELSVSVTPPPAPEKGDTDPAGNAAPSAVEGLNGPAAEEPPKAEA